MVPSTILMPMAPSSISAHARCGGTNSPIARGVRMPSARLVINRMAISGSANATVRVNSVPVLPPQVSALLLPLRASMRTQVIDDLILVDTVSPVVTGVTTTEPGPLARCDKKTRDGLSTVDKPSAVISVIGFPHGAQSTTVKVFEAEEAIRNGNERVIYPQGGAYNLDLEGATGIYHNEWGSFVFVGGSPLMLREAR